LPDHVKSTQHQTFLLKEGHAYLLLGWGWLGLNFNLNTNFLKL
jgi:hypothetical protein